MINESKEFNQLTTPSILYLKLIFVLFLLDYPIDFASYLVFYLNSLLNEVNFQATKQLFESNSNLLF